MRRNGLPGDNGSIPLERFSFWEDSTLKIWSSRMTYLSRNVLAVVFAGLLTTWSVGCCHDTDPLRVDVQLNDSVRDNSTGQYPAVSVDLVGVNPSEYQKWSTYSMTKYWSVDNPYGAHRGDMVFQVSLGDGLPKTLPDNDPIWQRWEKEGVTSIFVMSSFPKTGDDQTGSADSRRNIIPMECARWKDGKPKALTVMIKSDGVTLVPSPLPEGK
jgi:hypothetical protein